MDLAAGVEVVAGVEVEVLGKPKAQLHPLAKNSGVKKQEIEVQRIINYISRASPFGGISMKVQSKKMTALLTIALAILMTGCSKSNKQIVDSAEFKEPGYCESCHRELHSQWKGSPHSNAQKDPIYQKLYQLAEEETKGKAEELCAASICHTPIGSLAREIPPIDGSKLSEIAKLGVQCDFCHTISDMEKVGNGSYIVSPGRTKMGPFKDSDSPAHDTNYSALQTQAKFCGLCHNVNHPQNNLPLEATFTEWDEGPYNTGDPDTSTLCQDCHMTPGPGETFKNPGKASSLGPDRPLIHTHDFAGANVALAQLMGSPRHAQLAEERLKAAATVTITGPNSADRGQPIILQVGVKNVGAGHKIPTGLTEMRQMWLEVVATDGAGSYIYTSGFVDNDGRIDPGCVMFNTVLGDAKGKRTLHAWNAERILSDNRIPPGQMKVEKYTIKVPPDVAGPMTIEVKLRYRSAPQDLVDQLLGPKTIKLPITDMAQGSVVIPVR